MFDPVKDVQFNRTIDRRWIYGFKVRFDFVLRSLTGSLLATTARTKLSTLLGREKAMSNSTDITENEQYFTNSALFWID